jgi:hypothetical protein
MHNQTIHHICDTAIKTHVKGVTPTLTLLANFHAWVTKQGPGVHPVASSVK